MLGSPAMAVAKPFRAVRYSEPAGPPEALVAALRTEPYEKRVVLPHERTHRGPKEGRLRLLRETRAQLEPLFFLYEGDPPAARPDREPDLEADGARLWRLPESAGIEVAFAD